MMTKNVTALGAIALLGAVALTACSQPADPSTPSSSAPGTATASATPSPTASKSTPAAAPTTDDEAQKQAFAAVKAYWELGDQILLRDKGKNPERIYAVATGAAAAETFKYAKAYAASTDTATGNSKVTPFGGYTSQLTVDGKAYPHGNAELKVCSDVTDIKWVNSKGQPNPRPEQTRTLQTVGVVFVPSQGKWLVTKSALIQPVQPC